VHGAPGQVLLLKSIATGFATNSGPGHPFLEELQNVPLLVYLVAYVISQIPGLQGGIGISDATMVLVRNLGPIVGLLQVAPSHSPRPPRA
jgi:hypothetical protein